MSLAAHRHALLALAVVSFAESSVFPIPPDVLLIPMILAARERAWLIAPVCTVASVVVGAAGYGIGDRKSVVLGKSVSLRLVNGGRLHIQQKHYHPTLYIP